MCVRERIRIPLGTLSKILLFVGTRAHSVPRGPKLIFFYLAGVDCFGYVSYSTSSELTVNVLVTFRILPRRACWLIGRDGSIMLTPIRRPTLTRGRCAYHRLQEATEYILASKYMLFESQNMLFQLQVNA